MSEINLSGCRDLIFSEVSEVMKWKKKFIIFRLYFSSRTVLLWNGFKIKVREEKQQKMFPKFCFSEAWRRPLEELKHTQYNICCQNSLKSSWRDAFFFWWKDLRYNLHVLIKFHSDSKRKVSITSHILLIGKVNY